MRNKEVKRRDKGAEECNVYVKLKDRKLSLSRKKRSQRVVALEKQPQREVSCYGCF